MNPDQNTQDPQQGAATPSTPEPTDQQGVRYIAVDANGNPVPNQPAYNYPPADQSSPQGVYMSRPLQPQEPHMSEEIERRCEESRKKYPSLNLSKGEYIISAVDRHPIGLLSIWLVVGFAMLILVGALIAFAAYRDAALSDSSAATVASLPSPAVVVIPVLLLMVVALLGGYIATIVYRGNKFFLTNESVIQEIQTSLFSKREQTVSLTNIEDASFTQHGIIQMLIGYGSIRLSTEGDETTYRFHYVANPKKQIALLNNAVEAFKNGRPIEG